MLPTGFRTFHFVSFLYVFFFPFFSFSFVSFLFSLFCFRFFAFSFFFRFFSLLFSSFSFRFFFLSVSFRFFSFFSVSQFTGTLGILGHYTCKIPPYSLQIFTLIWQMENYTHTKSFYLILIVYVLAKKSTHGKYARVEDTLDLSIFCFFFPYIFLYIYQSDGRDSNMADMQIRENGLISPYEYRKT